MIAYQLVIPSANIPGKLAEVSGILAKEKINIRAITITSFGDKGFFHILPDDPKLAQKVLVKKGIPASLKEIIAVVIDDKPGGMNKLVKLLAEQGVNIENAYGFVLEANKTAVFVIDVSDLKATQAILKENKFKCLCI